MIQADPETIWAILVDGAKLLAVGFRGRTSGGPRIGPGEKIKVVSDANPGRAFPVTVAEFTPGQQMTWAGGMPLGLFEASAPLAFSSSPHGGGVTRFTMREQYTGPLLSLIWRSMPDLEPSFEQLATGLKSHAEAAG